MSRGEAGCGLLGTWTPGKGSGWGGNSGKGEDRQHHPCSHRRDYWGDGVVVALKCSMTQIQLFYFATSAEAESRLDYREVLLICTER